MSCRGQPCETTGLREAPETCEGFVSEANEEAGEGSTASEEGFALARFAVQPRPGERSDPRAEDAVRSCSGGLPNYVSPPTIRTARTVDHSKNQTTAPEMNTTFSTVLTTITFEPNDAPQIPYWNGIDRLNVDTANVTIPPSSIVTTA